MFVVLNKNGIALGPFADAEKAHAWARKEYPDSGD